MKRLARMGLGVMMAASISMASAGVASADTTLAKVNSSYMPLPGQTHRSSQNFSTKDAPGNAHLLCFGVSNNDHAGSIKFAVKEDIRGGTDPVKYTDVRNGSCLNIVRSGALYIADPSGANNHDFLVTVNAR